MISGDTVDWPRPRYSTHRVLIEQLHGFLYGALELRVPPLDYISRRVFDFDIRSDAFVFNCPLSGQVIKCQARSGDSAAVNGSRNAEGSYQTTPGASAHERSELSQPEIVRQGIAARTRRFVNDHDLRTIDARNRGCRGLAVAHREISQQLA